MNTPNLRDWQPEASQAKDVYSTPMLDVVAKEPADTVTAENSTKEHVVKHPTFPKLGAMGRM